MSKKIIYVECDDEDVIKYLEWNKKRYCSMKSVVIPAIRLMKKNDKLYQEHLMKTGQTHEPDRD